MISWDYEKQVIMAQRAIQKTWIFVERETKNNEHAMNLVGKIFLFPAPAGIAALLPLKQSAYLLKA
jgi:hypothetical protein